MNCRRRPCDCRHCRHIAVTGRYSIVTVVIWPAAATVVQFGLCVADGVVWVWGGEVFLVGFLSLSMSLPAGAFFPCRAASPFAQDSLVGALSGMDHQMDVRCLGEL